jgi:hypothetical protein
MIIIANIILVISAMIGMYCVAHKRKVGFIIFTFVESSMGYIGYSSGNYGLCLAAMLYFGMNIYSYIQWSK